MRACCVHAVCCMLRACCMRAACVLHVCCVHAACMLHAACVLRECVSRERERERVIDRDREVRERVSAQVRQLGLSTGSGLGQPPQRGILQPWRPRNRVRCPLKPPKHSLLHQNPITRSQGTYGHARTCHIIWLSRNSSTIGRTASMSSESDSAPSKTTRTHFTRWKSDH